MRWKQIQEKSITLPDEQGYNFVITQNPSKQQFLNSDIINTENDFKGLITDNEFFYWPAWHAHHGQVLNAIGINPDIDDVALVTLAGYGIDAATDDHKLIINNPYIKLAYGENLILVS